MTPTLDLPALKALATKWLRDDCGVADCPCDECQMAVGVLALLAEVERLRQGVEVRDAMLRDHANAAACFQPGGDLHARANLPLGSLSVVGGIEWLRHALKQAETEVERLRERVLELKEAETHCTRLYREQVSEVDRLREAGALSIAQDHKDAELIGTLNRALATVTAERDRLRELLHLAEWYRRDDGRTHLAVRVTDFADLSCKATRDDAIDAALAKLAEPRKGE